MVVGVHTVKLRPNFVIETLSTSLAACQLVKNGGHVYIETQDERTDGNTALLIYNAAWPIKNKITRKQNTHVYSQQYSQKIIAKMSRDGQKYSNNKMLVIDAASARDCYLI
jgi:hypothetical protein